MNKEKVLACLRHAMNNIYKIDASFEDEEACDSAICWINDAISEINKD